MRIEVGPVARASAEAWLDYAEGVLALLRDVSPGAAPEATLESFSELLVEWRGVVADPGDFHWITERPVGQVEYLVKALYEAGLVVEEQHEVGRAELRPAEADAFHIALVNQVLAALLQEGDACAQFVEMLRSDWGVAAD